MRNSSALSLGWIFWGWFIAISVTTTEADSMTAVVGRASSFARGRAIQPNLGCRRAPEARWLSPSYQMAMVSAVWNTVGGVSWMASPRFEFPEEQWMTIAGAPLAVSRVTMPQCPTLWRPPPG